MLGMYMKKIVVHERLEKHEKKSGSFSGNRELA
jgi:hypothetical protein